LSDPKLNASIERILYYEPPIKGAGKNLPTQEQEFQEDLKFLNAKMAQPKEQREKWLNEIVDKWIARRHAKAPAKKSKKSTKRK
jgi:hypothetical protein